MSWYVHHDGRVNFRLFAPQEEGWSKTLDPDKTPDFFDPENEDVWLHLTPVPGRGDPVFVPLRVEDGRWVRAGDVLTLEEAVKTMELSGEVWGAGVKGDASAPEMERWR